MLRLFCTRLKMQEMPGTAHQNIFRPMIDCGAERRVARHDRILVTADHDGRNADRKRRQGERRKMRFNQYLQPLWNHADKMPLVIIGGEVSGKHQICHAPKRWSALMDAIEHLAPDRGVCSEQFRSD